MPLRRSRRAPHWNPSGLPAGVSPGIYESTTLSRRRWRRPMRKTASPRRSPTLRGRSRGGRDRARHRRHPDRQICVGARRRPPAQPAHRRGPGPWGLAHGLGAALMEELAYDAGGNFPSGTFADYLCPTAMEMPPVTIGHVETRSPMNVLGARAWATAARCSRPPRSPMRSPTRSAATTSRCR